MNRTTHPVALDFFYFCNTLLQNNDTKNVVISSNKAVTKSNIKHVPKKHV